MHPKVYAVAALTISKFAAFNIKEVEQIVGGLLQGFVNDDHLDSVELCLKDAQTLDEEITEAVTDFTKKDLTDIIKGIQELGVVAGQFSGDLKDCEGMKADAARVEAWAAIFTQPKVLVPTLIKNVLKNYKTIMADVSDISTEMAADDYKKVGMDFADILVSAVGPVPAATQPEDLILTQW